MRRKHYRDVSIEAFKADGASFEVAAEGGVTVSSELDRQSMVGKLQTLIDETLSEKQRFAIRASLAGLARGSHRRKNRQQPKLGLQISPRRPHQASLRIGRCWHFGRSIRVGF